MKNSNTYFEKKFKNSLNHGKPIITVVITTLMIRKLFYWWEYKIWSIKYGMSPIDGDYFWDNIYLTWSQICITLKPKGKCTYDLAIIGWEFVDWLLNKFIIPKNVDRIIGSL